MGAPFGIGDLVGFWVMLLLMLVGLPAVGIAVWHVFSDSFKAGLVFRITWVIIIALNLLLLLTGYSGAVSTPAIIPVRKRR